MRVPAVAQGAATAFQKRGGCAEQRGGTAGVGVPALLPGAARAREEREGGAREQ